MAGALTTHVLDTMQGGGAGGMRVEVRRLDPSPTETAFITLDEGGRARLIEGPALTAGHYEILFHVGDYLRGLGIALDEPAFLDIVPIRFGIADPSGHTHVPLLVSRYGYSTYRGG